ncbi:TPA: flagellin [Yersinia enterocolitica]|uniref:flagellin N-terminal helical domain-containing protein n=1 Tax=Yersinia enterocolitica TaxID=630 RepID=UPI0028B712B6|nr:flagellin [Yersinia enterocolitica]EKN3826538.1 flagellin [Yersinia enterocolitica]EKN4824612.1 flagellin [Yersinia enterocolitica]EKN5141937.1 flagellar protein FlaA [Yersinia enterocolitica]ELI7900802.1 flagellin [Yersinia enterocolitica]
MGLSVLDQSQAFIAAKALNRSQGMYNQSTSQLSTGLRILSAKDDAAGSQIAAGLNAVISGQNVALRNNAQSSAMLDAANGALAGSDGILNRMKDLATQASNATNGVANRTAMEAEFKELANELKDTLEKTTFGDGTLFAAGGKLDGELVFQTGASATDTIKLDISKGVEDLRDTVSKAKTVGDVNGSGIEKLLGDKEKDLADAKKAQEAGQDAFDKAQFAFNNIKGVPTTSDVTTWETAAKTYNDLAADTAKAEGALEDLKKNDKRYESGGLTSLKLSDATEAQAAITAITKAIESYGSVTGALAAGINRLGYSSDNLTNMRDGNQVARDTIVNADAVSAATAQNTAMLLMQSGIKSLSKNTQMGQMVAQLF